MPVIQDISGCLEGTLGGYGLSAEAFEGLLEKLRPALEALKSGHESGSMPLLRVPGWTDDIEEARRALERLSKDARTLVFFGTGGSSLGGQAIAQLGGWNIPGDMSGEQSRRPRTRFYDNLDPRTLERALAALDPRTTRFIVISKSGGTAETLVQALSAIARVRSAGLDVAERFLGLTEPSRQGVANGLRTVLESFGVPCLDHSPDIGGRFSALTNVGLLPALARGLDPCRLRAGAKSVIDAMLAADEPAAFAPAAGAAVAVGLARERGVNAQVLMPYADRLERFARWFCQLWAESLGKQGEGATPVAALGPVDQHSQLQMLLDGPRHHLVTLIRTGCAGVGPEVDGELARMAGASYLAGRKAGDLVAAQQLAITDALRKGGRPVRAFDVDVLDESALGGLMMHFMIETILAGHLLGVDPFGQPAVEECKRLARQRLEE